MLGAELPFVCGGGCAVCSLAAAPDATVSDPLGEAAGPVTDDPNSELPDAIGLDPDTPVSDAEEPDTFTEAPDESEPLKLPDTPVSWAEDPPCSPLAVVWLPELPVCDTPKVLDEPFGRTTTPLLDPVTCELLPPVMVS